jgi:hypothetical protein
VDLVVTTSADTAFTLEWYGGDAGYKLASKTYQLTSDTGHSISFSSSVRGTTLALVFRNAWGPIHPYVAINGTNRATREAISNLTPFYKQSMTRTWVPGVAVPIGVPYTSNGGAADVMLTWANPGAGYMGYQYITDAGVRDTVLLTGTYAGIADGAGNTVVHTQHAFPPGIIQPVFYATVASTSIAQLAITQMEF